MTDLSTGAASNLRLRRSWPIYDLRRRRRGSTVNSVQFSSRGSTFRSRFSQLGDELEETVSRVDITTSTCPGAIAAGVAVSNGFIVATGLPQGRLT